VERSITQGDGPEGTGDPKAHDGKTRRPKQAEGRAGAAPPAEEIEEGAAGEPARGTAEWLARICRNRALWGIGLILLCLAAYYFIQPNRSNLYTHFILQAQAWLDGHTAIPMPRYQDVMPTGVRPDGSSCLPSAEDLTCVATGYGIIPFPPMPAWVLLPFVSLWHLATDQKLASAVFAAIDVGLGYWMLGYLPIRHRIRVLTSLFLGLGTVLWYTAAIGSTWFWAHVVAMGCLLLSVGLALAADRDAAEPESLRAVVTPTKPLSWPGGWPSAILLGALGALGELLFVLAGNGASAAPLAAVGLVLGLAAAALAVVVAGRPGVLGPFVIAVAIVGGLPAILLVAAWSQEAMLAIDAVLVVTIAVLWWQSDREGGRADRALTAIWRALSSPESLQVGAGILFGLAVTARLTILFGFPFLMLVGGGGSRLRRGMLAGAGAAVPLVTLLVVTYATSGHLFNPAYDYLYRNEVGLPLNYHADWSITDIRYIPQNLMIMLFGTPDILPSRMPSVYPGYGDPACVATTVRGLFDPACPLASPNAVGTSILLSSPAFLLAPLAWRPIRHLKLDRATVGATIAVLAIAIVNLMHFSQGWVQFGYRFSNDFVPFALILVALGASRLARLWPVVLLVGASIAVNFWGTMWGVTLGW
jgi:hypothetical protein